MTRRSIFRLAMCAVAASAMEVCGWAPESGIGLIPKTSNGRFVIDAKKVFMCVTASGVDPGRPPWIRSDEVVVYESLFSKNGEDFHTRFYARDGSIPHGLKWDDFTLDFGPIHEGKWGWKDSAPAHDPHEKELDRD